jgi:hypothetical protein
MSALESEAKPLLLPLIEGRRSVLSPKDQKVLSTWCMKTVLMLEQIHPVCLAPPAHYRYLYEHRRPWPVSFVWIARYDDPTYATRYQRAEYYITDVLSGTPTVGNGFVVTLSLQHLVFQVLCLNGEGQLKVDDDRIEYRDAIRNIFPLTGEPLSWPPPVSLDPAIFESYADSLVDARMACMSQSSVDHSRP